MSRSGSSSDDGGSFWRFWGEDEASAGETYELARRKLITFFTSKRVNVEAEELADIVLDEVLDDMRDGKQINNLMAYCYGVAVNIFRENVRGGVRKRRYAEAVKHRAINGDFRVLREDEEQAAASDETWEMKRSRFKKWKDEELTEAERRLWDEFYKYDKGQRKIEHREMLAGLMFEDRKPVLYSAIHKLRKKFEKYAKPYLKNEGA